MQFPITFYKSSLFLLSFRPALDLSLLCHHRALLLLPPGLCRLLRLEAMKTTSTSGLTTLCLRRSFLPDVFQGTSGVLRCTDAPAQLQVPAIWVFGIGVAGDSIVGLLPTYY